MIWTDFLTIFFAQFSNFLFSILQTILGALLSV